jgi:hypothetical protein
MPLQTTKVERTVVSTVYLLCTLSCAEQVSSMPNLVSAQLQSIAPAAKRRALTKSDAARAIQSAWRASGLQKLCGVQAQRTRLQPNLAARMATIILNRVICSPQIDG